MPPEHGVIAPRPAHRSLRTPHLQSDRRASFILTFITLTILVVAFLQHWVVAPVGSVSLLIRAADGTRTVETLALDSGTRTSRTDIDPITLTTLSTRTFYTNDGTITIDDMGVVMKAGETKTILIASPVPPPARTPLAVTKDGSQIAWVSPADHSIQVFTRNTEGTYLPSHVSHDLIPNSIGFTEDGSTLVLAKLTDTTTSLHTITLSTGSITHLTTIDGLVSVVPTL